MSDSTKTWYRRDGESIILTLHVQPCAKRTEVAGIHDGALKIKIGAAPVEGQANAKLVEFLKKAFDVQRQTVGGFVTASAVLFQGPHGDPVEVAAELPEERVGFGAMASGDVVEATGGFWACLGGTRRQRSGL